MAKITIIQALKKLWNATTELLAGKQDKLRAGSNILINGNTISAITDAGFSIEIVQSVPSRGLANTIYFVPVTGGISPNVYDEYMFINGAIEKIGSTEIDLSNYYNKTQVDNLLAGKQGTLTAGTNIDITNNTIKANGYRYNTNNGAFAEGDRNIVDGGITYSKSTATGLMAHAEGNDCTASGNFSHAEGKSTTAQGKGSHAEGSNTSSIGDYSHVEGVNSTSSGHNSHAEGNGSNSIGQNSHAEGTRTIANNNQSHAEGYETKSMANGAHAEGDSTIAYGKYSHAEGANSVTGYDGIKPNTNNLELPSNTNDGIGGYAHAEGSATLAISKAAHSEGCKTFAAGEYSHAEGMSTKALCNAEHAQGSYNVSHHVTDSFDGNVGNTVHSIGIGTADDERKNAVEVMQNGDTYLLGVGNYDGVHIKGQSGAPTGLRTLQEVVSGLRTDLENGLNECQKTVYPYARFNDATGEVTGDYPDGGGYYDEDESYFVANYVGAYSGNGGRVVCVRPWRITELITNDNMGVPIELLLVDPMYNSVDEWYANREYIIRVVCDGADGNLSVPSSIRWATPQIHRDLADQLGISIDDYAYMPPLRDGHTYDIHILNGVAWWVETPNA